MKGEAGKFVDSGTGSPGIMPDVPSVVVVGFGT